MKKFILGFVIFLTGFSSLGNHLNAQEFKDLFVIGPQATWRYFANIETVDENWTYATYDDSTWLEGMAGFGYGDDDDNTRLEDMEGNYDTVHIRRNFELKSVPKNLYLYIHYDDAFIAYVNGKEFKRVGVKKDDIDGHEAKGFEVYKIKGKKYLSEGTNVIAIKGFNKSIDSSDFSLWPAIATTKDALGIETSYAP